MIILRKSQETHHLTEDFIDVIQIGLILEEDLDHVARLLNGVDIEVIEVILIKKEGIVEEI